MYLRLKKQRYFKGNFNVYTKSSWFNYLFELRTLTVFREKNLNKIFKHLSSKDISIFIFMYM